MLNVSPYQAVSRIMVTVLFFVSGSVVATLFYNRKKTEESLKVSEARYRTMAENFPHGALILFDRDFRCLVANGQVFGQIGLPPHQVIGKTLEESFPELWPSTRPHLEAALHGKGSQFSTSYQGRTYANQALPVINDQGEMLGQGLIIAQDVTESLRLQAEKEKIESQYHQAQKVEAIGRLAGGVAHDLNNLLSPIIGYGEILLLNTSDDARTREAVSQIVKAGLRAKDLLGQLLAFSRKQTLEYKPVNLNEIIRDFEKLLRRTVREDIEIRTFMAPSLRTIKADTGQIEQVLMNLVLNAQDAMPDGGNLTIETFEQSLDEEYPGLHGDLGPGEYVVLAISDDGNGMDQETQEKIFDPFFSTKGENGTGLGLATVYGIVTQHGGTIRTYSEMGRGTTFKVYLPVPREKLDETVVGKKPITNLMGNEFVLLVEDHEPVRQLVTTILESFGYSVLVASSGEMALEILEKHEGRLDLLLTDVVMPGLNGKELYDEVLKFHPHIKVLYMSGYPDNVIAHRGVLDEGIFFIQKPFTAQGLAQKIRETMEN